MYFEFPGEKLFPMRSHFRGEAIFGEKPFLGRSRFRGEAIFKKKTLLPLSCKECSKSFSVVAVVVVAVVCQLVVIFCEISNNPQNHTF